MALPNPSALDADESFRARVADGAEESELGRAGWLFLTRPSGWHDELDGLAAAAADEQRDTDALRSELTAQRRVEQRLRNGHKRKIRRERKRTSKLEIVRQSPQRQNASTTSPGIAAPRAHPLSARRGKA